MTSYLLNYRLLDLCNQETSLEQSPQINLLYRPVNSVDESRATQCSYDFQSQGIAIIKCFRSRFEDVQEISVSFQSNGQILQNKEALTFLNFKDLKVKETLDDSLN